MKTIWCLILLFFIASCTEIASNRQVAGGVDQGVGDGGIGGDTGGGNGAVPDDGSLDTTVTEEIEAKVEIRHLIEPKVDEDSTAGTYTRKLTIPKNYDGYLYVAGINVSTLTEKNLKVRFKFGQYSSPITVPATIATAPGLTPQTGVEVLVMDLRSQPFSGVRLIYDLFDYNDYDFGSSDPDPGVLTEPVDNNRDSKLFCRGLNLQDDPTFTGSLAEGCNGPASVCKYAYAKILDKGLVQSNWLSPVLPTELNVASSGLTLDGDGNDINLARCLPDNPSSNSHTIDSYTFPFASQYNSTDSEWEIVPGSLVGLFDGSTLLGNYYYLGPYQAVNMGEWQVSDSAVYNQYGIFGDFLDLNTGTEIDQSELQYGIKSKMFPLQTKLNLPKDVQYMGSDVPGDTKIVKTMSSNGESQWMDGCNERISTMLNDYNGEHVGSCNVTATIEIIAVDDGGTESIIDATDEVKLQLVKPATLDTDGDNVLLSSFQSCSSSNQCGSDSCCINKRCWSKSIVSQCVEDLPTYGNGVPGDSCQSDNECSSLCCNQSTGKCAVHDTLSDPEVLCSKPSGQTCIAKEWCMKHPVTQCFIVNTGTDAQGQKTCALRCYTYEEHGDCQASSGSIVGVCTAPAQPEQPVFNPSDPNRCDEAIDPADVPISSI